MTRALDRSAVEEIAAAHDAARRTARQVRRVTLAHPEMTIDDAYACQQAWVDLQVGGGARIVGHKIGLTSRAMQRTMNIDEPDFGTLLDYMLVPSGTALPAAAYCDPQIEVELAFVLSRPLGGSEVTTDDVLAATGHIVPALELIDARSHRTDPTDHVTRTVRDTIADNAANAGVVLGERGFGPRDRDLRWVAAVLKRNGVVEETGVAAGVLDDPVLGVAWLARRLHGYGVQLAAGEVILCGSFTRPVVCRAGDRIEVEYRDLGTVTVSFA